MARHGHLTPSEVPPSDLPLDEQPRPDPSFRAKVAKGVVGAFAYQVFSASVSLVSLFLVARLVSPAEFGAFVLVNLVLQALTGLAMGMAARHALYRGDGAEPPWNLYFLLLSAGQSVNVLLCNALAAACWFVPAYRPYAPLLHLASAGYVLDAFAELDRVMALKRLEFGRLQILTGTAEVLRLVVVLSFAWAGRGLIGLVLGNSVLISLPFVVHLFLVRRWRPDPSRWRAYTRAEMLPPVRFALHYSAANGGNALRQFAESALIPLAFSTGEVGLVSRALGLYSQTAGRVLQGVNDTASAALASLNADPARFRRGAVAYLKVIGGLLFAAVGFLGAAGPTLSAVVYGPSWKEADPFILPAAAQAAMVFFVGVCSTTLLAAGRQRSNLLLLGFLAAGAVPSLIALAARATPEVYLWTQGVSFMAVAGVALLLCRPVVGLRDVAGQLAPAGAAAIIASACCSGVEWSLRAESKWLRLPADVFAFGAVYLAMMRFAFPGWLAESLNLLPKGDLVRRWLRL